MNKKEFEILLDRYKSGQATAAEKQLLYRYYNAFIQHHDLEDFDPSEAENRLRQWSPVMDIEPTRKRLFPWRQVAAIFVIASVAAIYYFRTIQIGTDTDILSVQESIGAPVSKAIAILPSGDTVLLDGTQESAQKLLALQTKGKQTKEQLITVKTPRSGKLHFTLPDGSSVWLNSETTMTYPAAFGEDNRSVKLEGEAYFEVVQIQHGNSKTPFTVHSAQQEITVLGTKFNIAAYPDESVNSTTLAEGSVAVRRPSQASSTLLKPNQQYIASPSGEQVVSVNASETIAWKEGIITLSNQDLSSIIRMIERNYDVTFESSGLPRDLKFNGELQTTLALDELLDVLEINSGLQFRRNGKTITIVKNK